MKKVTLICLFISLFSVFILAQSGKRPRIVVTPNPTPEVEEVYSDSQTSQPNTQVTPKRPPVLIGDTRSKTPSNAPVLNGGQPSPNATPPTEDIPIEDDEVIKIETSLVTLPVSVLDREGRFIAGLRKENFQIFEDGVQQPIEYFASVEQPFTVALLIDLSPSTKFKIDEIQAAAIAFTNQLRQNDKVMIISFSDRVRILCEPTNNRTVLQNAIRDTFFGSGTTLYDAVDTAFDKLRQMQGRKAVVLFTDGVDTTSKRGNYQSTVREAEEMDALIYPIRYDTFADNTQTNGGGNGRGRTPSSGGGIIGAVLGAILGGGNVNIGGGGGTSKQEYGKGLLYLQDLARVSGGRFFSAIDTNNLDTSFKGIAEELRRQYSLGYMPETIGQAGQRKQIKVRINRANAVVKTRTSYIVGENDKKTAGK